jgi:hypothetical protein
MAMVSALKPQRTGSGGFDNAIMNEQWRGSLSIEK